MDSEIMDILKEIFVKIEFLDLKLDRLSEKIDNIDLCNRKSSKEIQLSLVRLRNEVESIN